MGLISHVPYSNPILPRSIIDSMLIDDDLAEERLLAYETFGECCEIYNQYFETGSHPLITKELMKWSLTRTEMTTLLTHRSETADWMVRLSENVVALNMKALCSYFNKLGPVLDYLRANPQMGIAFVSNFPHGTMSPEESAQTIRDNIKILRDEGITNPIDVDTVMNYAAWMAGDFDLVRRTLAAEGAACREMGVANWKPILNICVHAHEGLNQEYGGDFFGSGFDATTMVLEEGGTPKTSTGQAAAPPFNEFDPKDAGHIAAALPMIMAVRRYNRKHGTKISIKISGNVESPADIAVFVYALKKLAPEMLENVIFGTNYRFPKTTASMLHALGEPVDEKLIAPYKHLIDEIPEYMLGLPESPEPGGL